MKLLSQTRIGSLMPWLILSITLTGCQKQTDLDVFIEEVKGRPAVEPPPIPQITAYTPYAYPEHNRDPFDQTVVAAKVQTRGVSTGSIKVDQNRVKEYLESFPLDTLKMVGTLEQNANLWALIQTPDGTIQRVRGGNHIGQNHGRVNEITPIGIKLIEVVPDGFGGLMEQPAAIALSNK